jgi:hypothetical protein
MRVAGVSIFLSATIFLVVTGLSTADLGGPTAREILKKAACRYDFIRDYAVDARLDVESPSTHISNMDLRIFFKSPNRVHLESRGGFAVLPRRGAIVGNPVREFASVRRPAILRSERVFGRDCWVVGGTIRRADLRARAAAWIDKRNFAVRRMKIARDFGVSEEIELQYSETDRKQVFPISTRARLFTQPIGEPGLKTAGPIGPSTIVKISFSNYRINAGLPDEIFNRDSHR